MDSLLEMLEESMSTPLAPAPDLTRLAAELCVREYSPHARAAVLGYARATGCLEACPEVDPSDRADLDAILEDSWPAIGYASSAWDESPWKEAHRQPTWTLERSARIAALYEAHGATLTADDDAGIDLLELEPVPPELDGEPCEHDEADELFYAAWSDSLPPVTLDVEPFHP